LSGYIVIGTVASGAGNRTNRIRFRSVSDRRSNPCIAFYHVYLFHLLPFLNLVQSVEFQRS